MFWLKKCPRCSGDLIGESDVHGTFVTCLQCGHMLSAAEEEALRREAGRQTPPQGGSRRAGAA
jgi:hypothetical protein